MKSRLMCLITMVVLASAFLGAFRFAVAQNGAPADKPCIGCSKDGKTTPRLADGHPDLNGFWNNMAGVGNNIAARRDDGSVLFDFAGAGFGADGATTSSTPG